MPHKKINAVAVAVLCLLWSTVLGAQEPHGIKRDLRYLADDALEGRGVGTAGLDSAAQYIARRFREIALTPGGSDGYLQWFTIDSSAPVIAHSGMSSVRVSNVVGIIPGLGTLADQAVVVGAHYDHLGLGGTGSLDSAGTGVVHNGADDNASGTAALIEAARILSARSAEDRRMIVFVAFTAEELGLIGSDYYVKHPVVPAGRTLAMINFDMVGRLQENGLLAIGTGSAEELSAIVSSMAERHAINVRVSPNPWGRSDHSSFYGARIPVLHLFTGTHTDYHRSTDDWDKIDLGGVRLIANYAADLVSVLATESRGLTFLDVPQPRTTASGGYGAYLGTIPDMSETPGGVRLNGVSSGSPADLAGLERGDILIQIGEHEVADLYAMTSALRAHKPGDHVTLVVLRNGERIELSATLGKRNE